MDFDVCCESLEEKELQAEFTRQEYPTYFDYTCLHCGTQLEIEVDALPVFIHTKRTG